MAVRRFDYSVSAGGAVRYVGSPNQEGVCHVATTVAVKGAIRQRRRLDVALSALMTLIAAMRFWPTYHGPLVRLTLAQAPLIHVHAIVFTDGWLCASSASAMVES
jgi:hypothetical protein